MSDTFGYHMENEHVVHNVGTEVPESGAVTPNATQPANSTGGANGHGPDYYRKYKIQPWDLLVRGVPWAEGSCISYLLRWREKGGLDDLRKVQHIVAKLIEVEEAEAGV